MTGVLIIDKPAGVTSRQCVDRVIAATGIRKAGHAGTLDPFATGVLPVCLGRATKLIQYLHLDTKTYQACLRFDVSSDTQDITGLLSPSFLDRPVPELEEIEVLVNGFLTDYKQIPPMFSAKKIDGNRLYSIARENRSVPRHPVPVKIYQLKIIDYRYPVLKFEVECSKGTYIRTLGVDIAAELGRTGVLVALRRTRHGGFGLEKALPYTELSLNRTGGIMDWRHHLLPAQTMVGHLPVVRLHQLQLRPFKYGQRLAVDRRDQLDGDVNSGIVSVFTRYDRFLGIGRIFPDPGNDSLLLKCEKLIDIDAE